MRHPCKREYKKLKRAFQYNVGFSGFVYKHICEYKKLYPSLAYWYIKKIINFKRLVIGILRKDKEKIKYQLYCYHGRMHGKKEWKKRYL